MVVERTWFCNVEDTAMSQSARSINNNCNTLNHTKLLNALLLFHCMLCAVKVWSDTAPYLEPSCDDVENYWMCDSATSLIGLPSLKVQTACDHHHGTNLALKVVV